MKNRTFVVLAGSALLALTVVGLLTSSLFTANYVKAVEPLINSLIEEKFDIARQYLLVPPNSDVQLFSDDKLKVVSSVLRNGLGDRVTIKFDRSQKVVSTNATEATPEGTTRVFFDLISNDRYVEVETLINDTSQKVQYLNLSNGSQRVPNYSIFAIYSILFLLIPVLNMYALVRIRSVFKAGRIWRYLTVLLLNIPTITCFATGFVNINVLADQIVLGFAIDLSGISQTSVSIGIPLGSVFWILKARNRPLAGRTNTNSGKEEIQESEILWQCPKCQESNPNSTFQCQKCGYSLK